jgi:hypothetical protein
VLHEEFSCTPLLSPPHHLHNPTNSQTQEVEAVSAVGPSSAPSFVLQVGAAPCPALMCHSRPACHVREPGAARLPGAASCNCSAAPATMVAPFPAHLLARSLTQRRPPSAVLHAWESASPVNQVPRLPTNCHMPQVMSEVVEQCSLGEHRAEQLHSSIKVTPSPAGQKRAGWRDSSHFKKAPCSRFAPHSTTDAPRSPLTRRQLLHPPWRG